jgi:hypothetical protein
MRSRLLRLGTSRAPVAAQDDGTVVLFFLSPDTCHVLPLLVGVWLVWTSSARPDQLIRKADRIKSKPI